MSTTMETFFYENWLQGSNVDQSRLEFGNCFKTPELAREAAKKIEKILINLDHE